MSKVIKKGAIKLSAAAPNVLRDSDDQMRSTHVRQFSTEINSSQQATGNVGAARPRRNIVTNSINDKLMEDAQNVSR